jgi:NADP-dependent 3-hydroxy acid dehydrogenase YdfG
MSRIAFITGATSGIGEATARIFAKNGIDLILCGRRKQRLDSLQDELRQFAHVRTLRFDVSNYESVRESITGLEEEWNRVEILVNNAGGAHGLDLLKDGSIDDWQKMIDSNVNGLLYVSKMLIPHMIKNQKGHIVNVGSIAGKQTYAKGTVYCAAKSGVEAISKGMRLELVPEGIKVSNIAPGAVETEFSNVRFKGDLDRAKQVYKGYKPLVAEDIANCIFFCVNAPDHVQIADMTIFPSAQSDATTIHRSQSL